MMGRGMDEQLSRASWRGDTLVIVTTHVLPEAMPDGSRTTEVRRLLSLAPPDSLVVQTVRAGVAGGPENVARTVYRRM